jgi:hypothetical protein
MIPILQPFPFSPGVMIPGQFGPIRREPVPATNDFTRAMSITGTPSVIATMRPMPASAASQIASAQKAAGT